MDAIQKQNDFFESHKAELLEKYAGRVIVIPDSLIVEEYPTLEEGYKMGVQKHGYGNFLLKECSPQEAQVQIISPIVTVI